ncbi:hypothetical protein LMG27952_06909 [Paraburkholderia hiiakae]|uniref:DNA helicase n=1 Tax=Paraburkholderia hiiakae TaxID=1081782 RepID=A0ABM8P948_9BURK|nr:ATP-binding domain-containing protein [Paraburkholderia hiiakae]CAD6559596.1 hypothetical protein LMG27952_06909 [Paraburkholderia hiiakae]
MARILPDGWKALRATGGAAREIETLEQLETGLPDGYTVYHSVHWTRLANGFSVFGELDFVVVSPSGRIMAIEQKAGSLEETAEGLAKTYSGKPKSVAQQISRSVSALRGRLSDAFGPRNYGVEELLYCPDYTVINRDIAGVPPARIVDATRGKWLADIVQQILPADEPLLPCHDSIHPFLAGELSLMPDAGAMIGTASQLVTQVSSGLATWARNIHVEPFRLRVNGTAGSGKTQLAIGVLHDAAAAGKRALYVCFNRPLADYIGSIAPVTASVMSFHKLCRGLADDLGVRGELDLDDESVCSALRQRLREQEQHSLSRYDVIVVDEGQDFLQPWVDLMEGLLAPGGSWWWLEDPMQNLYQRPALILPDRWVEVRAKSNYRSPRDIVRLLAQLQGLPQDVEAGSPIDGSDVEIVAYPDGAVVEYTRRQLDEAIALGYRPSDIAVLSFQGMKKSVLTGMDRLGEWSLRHPTGGYDMAGNQLYRDGEVLSDSVFRFKGQSASCVILTEVDFSQFDEVAQCLLFVGATRATMKLMVVMSERAAGVLLGRV